MGQILRRLLNQTSPPPPPAAASESPDDSQGNQERPGDGGARKSSKQAAQMNRKLTGHKTVSKSAKSTKAVTSTKSAKVAVKSAKSPDLTSEVVSRGFDLNQPNQTLDGIKFVAQPVDAISESKSTSGGTRRVYKVIRVAPSNFQSVSKHLRPAPPPPKTPIGVHQQQLQKPLIVPLAKFPVGQQQQQQQRTLSPSSQTSPSSPSSPTSTSSPPQPSP